MANAKRREKDGKQKKEDGKCKKKGKWQIKTKKMGKGKRKKKDGKNKTKKKNGYSRKGKSNKRKGETVSNIGVLRKMATANVGKKPE